MSEESTRDLEEVERRGLTGGINLVRGLREELRDWDFQLNEAIRMKDTCRAKISLIHSRMPKLAETQAPSDSTEEIIKSEDKSSHGEKQASFEKTGIQSVTIPPASGGESSDSMNHTSKPTINVDHSNYEPMEQQKMPGPIVSTVTKSNDTSKIVIEPEKPSKTISNNAVDKNSKEETKTPIPNSKRIASGDSDAIALRYVECM